MVGTRIRVKPNINRVSSDMNGLQENSHRLCDRNHSRGRSQGNTLLQDRSGLGRVFRNSTRNNAPSTTSTALTNNCEGFSRPCRQSTATLAIRRSEAIKLVLAVYPSVRDDTP